MSHMYAYYIDKYLYAYIYTYYNLDTTWIGSFRVVPVMQHPPLFVQKTSPSKVDINSTLRSLVVLELPSMKLT